ncbi:MAG TPA: hypothetical protein VF913_00005, partial [Xanthobacteraceae bacterium]
HHQQAWVPPAALDASHGDRVDLRLERKLLLRETPLLAEAVAVFPIGKLGQFCGDQKGPTPDR